MRALTLWQPWASLVAEGVKRIETRSWPCPPALIGHRIAIHAAKTRPKTRAMQLGSYRSVPLEDGRWSLTEAGRRHLAVMPFGAVLATVTVAACVPADDVALLDDWADMEPDVDRIDPASQSWVWSDPDYPEDGILASPLEGVLGDLSSGRWAWLLEDVEPLAHPVTARGGQRIWNWSLASVLTEGITA